MLLSELKSEMRDVVQVGTGDPGILSIVSDSRAVTAGSLFAAMPGVKDDGSNYLEEAVRRGAVALLTDFIPKLKAPMPCLVAEDVRKALGEAADSFYDHPSQSLKLVGITGTNGKTTTAYLLRHIMNQAGIRAGMLGSIEYDVGDKLEPAPLTTPDTVRFTRSLAEMRDFHCQGAVVEVSSHALSQERVWPHRFAAAVFTNLTRDHLDYHGDMESYLAAKRMLFERLDEGAVAVLNFRDPSAGRVSAGTRAQVTGYYLAEAGETGVTRGHRAGLVTSDLSGQTFVVEGLEGGGHQFRTPLVGRHNVENCLGALLTAHGLGIGIRTIADALVDFPGVPGRLERIEAPSGAMAFVDYAHTDGALRSVLSVLRPLVKGKLITVFGCGGDRDKGKRPLMAKAAEMYSDMVMVTSDNPRTEDPEQIIADIKTGFDNGDKVTVDPDRRTAIRLAMGMAGAGDAVLVAGKGHEDYQIVGTEKHHLDDRELVREAF